MSGVELLAASLFAHQRDSVHDPRLKAICEKHGVGDQFRQVCIGAPGRGLGMPENRCRLNAS